MEVDELAFNERWTGSKWAIGLVVALLSLNTVWAGGAKLPTRQSQKSRAKPKGKTPPVKTGPLYENNFEKAPVGKIPQDFLILNGAFNVVKDGDNSVLELPGEPLESFGLLFGPTESAGIAVKARITGVSKGRRLPTFGVGLNGVTGYKLRVAPGKSGLELTKDDEAQVTVPYSWKSGSWTHFSLQVTKAKSGRWKVEGKAWEAGTEEPKSWLVSWEDKEAPSPGRPSLWGAPYAGTPIYFDDLVVTRAVQ